MAISSRPDWENFEASVAEALQALGWGVELTKASNDFGADVIAVAGRDRLVVQCKFFGETRPLQSRAIREVMVAQKKYNAKLGLLTYRGVVSRRTYEYGMLNKVALLTLPQLVPGCFFDRRPPRFSGTDEAPAVHTPGPRVAEKVVVVCPACNAANRLPKGKDGVMRCGHCRIESFQRT